MSSKSMQYVRNSISGSDRGNTGNSLLGGLARGAGMLVLAGGAAALLYRPVQDALGRWLHRRAQRWLSDALGMRVRFRDFTLSLLQGEFDIVGVTITRPGVREPVLSVDRVRGRLDLARALTGDLVVREMWLERPVVSVVVRPAAARAGSPATNLPPQLETNPWDLAAKADHALEAAETAARAADKLGLRMHMGRTLVRDGEFRFRAPSLNGYELAASRIAAECERSGGGYDFHAVVGAFGRRDVPADLGEVRVRGRSDGPADLTRFDEVRVEMDVETGPPQQPIHAHVQCPSIGSRSCRADVGGETDLAALVPLLPEGVPVLEPLRTVGTHGRVEFSATVTYDPKQGLRVPEMQQSAHDVAVGGTKAGA